jgi:hypothetical protein
MASIEKSVNRVAAMVVAAAAAAAAAAAVVVAVAMVVTTGKFVPVHAKSGHITPLILNFGTR